jgi:N,N-dimethylformamidase
VEPEAVAAPLLVAAFGIPPTAHFNGKIEAPHLFGGPGPNAPLLAAWDFGRDISSATVTDISGNGLHGRTVNLPIRAVTGRNWTGRETNFALAPSEYGAIHFHDDDLEDARWDVDFELEVHDGLRSGVYAAVLRAETGGVDRVPFFVRPPRGKATAAIALLVPTLSYIAYANEHNSWLNPIPATPGIEEMLGRVGPADRYAAENRLLSIYERHSDGNGTCYSSRLRPIVNMRPGYVMPLLDGPHQFPADLELVAWLDVKEHEYDVVTDEDLHAEGAPLLAPYRVVLTGSHPEYWTGSMLDALEAYLDSGGRLMYLGGNGFYWVTSIDPERPHVLEVRRGHAGTRVWASAPGETHHASTGELGGLWRHRGRPPQRLAGVGFTAQGFDASLPYRRETGSFDLRAAFAFEGIADDGPIGGFGSVLGGAGGFEIDRLDYELGTPPHALCLASATGFSDAYQGVVEEILTADSKQGGTVNPSVRADLVFFETSNGGAVFSTGSIAWCGALAEDGFENDVSRITDNVLRRFAATAPFPEDETRLAAVPDEQTMTSRGPPEP